MTIEEFEQSLRFTVDGIKGYFYHEGGHWSAPEYMDAEGEGQIRGPAKPIEWGPFKRIKTYREAYGIANVHNKWLDRIEGRFLVMYYNYAGLRESQQRVKKLKQELGKVQEDLAKYKKQLKESLKGVPTCI